MPGSRRAGSLFFHAPAAPLPRADGLMQRKQRRTARNLSRKFRPNQSTQTIKEINMGNLNDTSKKNQQNTAANNAKSGINEPERLREFQESENQKAANQGKPRTNERQGDSCDGFDCM